MSKSQSLLSPKKADGTTDWDIVFDDPDRGLIPLIDRVRNVDTLQECTLFMIKRLFTRKNDQLAVARFSKNLDDIISNAATVGDFEAIKAEVVVMLRQIKAERVEKARQYIQQKNRRHKANRRTESARAANTYRFINHSKFMPIAIGGMVFLGALIIGVIYMLVVPDTKPSTARQKPEITGAALTEVEKQQIDKAEAKRQEQAEMTAKVAEATRIRDEKRKRIEEQKQNRVMPPALVLKAIFFQPQGSNNKRKSVSILPIIVLDDDRYLSYVCMARPIIFDAINVAINESLSSRSKKQSLELPELANLVRKRVDDQLPRSHIDKIILVEPTNYRDLAINGEECEFATNRYLDYIFPPENKE